MRNFIISASCLIIVVIIWCTFDSFASSKTQYYENQIDTIIYSYINNGDWERARISFNALHKDWNKYKKPAALFLDNNTLNHIDSTFRKIKLYISADDTSNSSGELAYLKGLFESLYKNESLSAVNIL